MEASGERLLVIGATSAIAHAVARRWAARGARLLLLGRNMQALESNAADLRVRGATNVQLVPFDALDVPGHARVLDQAFAAFGGFDAALVAWGHLPNQTECETSVEAALQTFDVNGRSVVALLTEIAPRFEAQRAGVIGVISSPAGDRGRASNYVYGAAKAAVTAMASGLRHRLARSGVRVVTLLPGYVDTPMTAAFQKGPLWASPERVARNIDAALKNGFGNVYTPWYWRWIMRVVRDLPERLFVRTRL
jgi:short-subunit dehydrogenase